MLLRSYANRAVRQLKSSLLPLTNPKAIPAYWWSSPRVPKNFGDWITPLILKHYGFTPVQATPNSARLFSTDSLIEHMRSNYAGYVLGTGAISDQARYSFPKARILGVRGKLTRALIAAPADATLGDPGLLAVKLAGIQANPQWTLGIVPHYVDQKDSRLDQLQEKYPSEIRVIDVRQDPIIVFREIASCAHILSSSLHGLVTADALGIPNRWIILSDNVLGGTFKFHDYYSSLDTTRTPLEMKHDSTLSDLIDSTQPAPAQVAAQQEELAACFDRFVAEYTAQPPHTEQYSS